MTTDTLARVVPVVNMEWPIKTALQPLMGEPCITPKAVVMVALVVGVVPRLLTIVTIAKALKAQ
jgi:hypothetical protein